jgi:NAD(P)-dependent dehydrogenase (short-subunit alcohol dehydrogenase family)
MQPEQTCDQGEFLGKRVLVTGGTKGIGAAVVKRFTDGGATVVTAARSLPTTASSDRFIQADVSSRDGCDRVITAVLDRFGGLDILINSVGGSTTPSGGALVLTDDHWQQTLDLNLLSAVRLDRGFLPAMLKQGSGVIIHVSSIQRTLPLHQATLAYAAAKSALTNYSKGLSKGMSPRGIRVNSVAPGYTETEAAVALVERYLFSASASS